MLYLILALLSMLSAAPVEAADHPHTWGSRMCGEWSCVRSCCQRTCYERCTYPGCPYRRPINETRGDCPDGPPLSDPMSVAVVPVLQRMCPPGQHEMGPEECAAWSQIKPGCRIRHCTSRCLKCGGNFGDRMDEDPPGCWK